MGRGCRGEPHGKVKNRTLETRGCGTQVLAMTRKLRQAGVGGRLKKLNESGRKELLFDLNYLNGGEIKAFCKRHGIPFKIAVENADGTLRGGAGEDRKGVMLRGVRHFLRTGVILRQTCYRRSVMRVGKAPKTFAAGDRIYYGEYAKANLRLMKTLRELTENRFENGAIARIALAKFWAAGRAPTVRELANAWLRARRIHTRPNAEWAFLADRAKGIAGAEWKKIRVEKARRVLGILRGMGL
jgi:hypothetical protein